MDAAITIYTVLGKSLTIKMVNALYIINLKQLSKENKEEIVQNLVEMQTTKNKDDLYKGSFVKNSNVYHIDYGNSFTSDQTLKVADGTLNVYF